MAASARPCHSAASPPKLPRAPMRSAPPAMRSSSGSSLPASRRRAPAVERAPSDRRPVAGDARRAPRCAVDHAQPRELGVGAADGRRRRAQLAAAARTLGSVAPGASSPVATRSSSALRDVAVQRHERVSYDAALMQYRSRQMLAALAAIVLIAGCGGGGDDDTASSERAPVILATTTSTQDSGLLDVLVPAFEQESGARSRPSRSAAARRSRWGRAGRPTSCSSTRLPPRRSWWPPGRGATAGS